MDDRPQLHKPRPDGFFLSGNIFINRLWLYTVMILIYFVEFSAAFGAFPSHRFTSANWNLSHKHLK
jgi:hypothetical protein